MRKLIVLSVVVLVLGFVSLAGAYTYSVGSIDNGDGTTTDMYGVFTNDSNSGATVDLTLYYGNGSSSSHYSYSVDGGSSWVAIVNSGDGQQPSDGDDGPGQSWAYGDEIAVGGEFWLKFVGGSGNDMDLTASHTDDVPYWFAFNNGIYDGTQSTGCVAIIENSPAVPIPGAIWLLGSGLGALMVTRRKRKA